MMNMRVVVYMLGCLAGSVFAMAPAAAAYPDKPVRLIMPYPAGGSIDTAGRAVAQKLADSGLRSTPQRELVYEVLLTKRDHPTAD